jgi:hypothetical protein
MAAMKEDQPADIGQPGEGGQADVAELEFAPQRGEPGPGGGSGADRP